MKHKIKTIEVGGVIFDKEKIEELIRNHTKIHNEASRNLRDLLHVNKKMKEQLKIAKEILEVVVEVNDEECWFDHHGYCQAHNLEEDCHIKKAREAIAALRELGVEK